MKGSNFLAVLEAKVKTAEQKWEESKENLDERDIEELKEWLIETMQEQFLAKIPEKVEPGSTFCVETAWYQISVTDEGYNFASRALFPKRIQLKEFLAEFKGEMSDMIKRQLECEIDDNESSYILVKFYFYC